MISERFSFRGESFLALQFSYRTILRQTKPYPLVDYFLISKMLEKYRSGFSNGDTGVYLGVYPQTTPYLSPFTVDDLIWYGRKALTKTYIWPIYDVDGDKKNISSSIEYARKMHDFLEKHGLAKHAHWLLSGSGFRIIFDFLVPFSFNDGWIEHLECLRREHFGVDRGPYSDTKDGGAPIRLFCYRNNILQCGEESKKVDRHSVLIDPEKISSMTEEMYLHLAKGKPDRAEYVKWTEQILPGVIYYEADELPTEIANFYELLRKHGRERQIRENIRSGSPFLKMKRPAIEQALAYLDSLGIDYKEVEIPFHFWKLSECPSCGEKGGNPWVLESGRLKCFRDTCEANMGEGGLPPSKWIPSEFFSGVYEEPPEEHSETKVVDLATAEKMIEAHLCLDGDLAIAVTPGVGKTYLAMEKAVSLAGDEVVIYAMPEHGVIQEWETKLRASHLEFPIIHFKGRNEETCKRDIEVKFVSGQGYYPSQVACVRCRHSPDRSSSYTCKYYLQFKKVLSEKRGLILCTTHQLPYLIESDRIGKVSTIFIDEQALRAMVQKDKGLKRRAFLSLKSKLSKDANDIMERILKAGDDLYQEVLKSAGHPIGCLYTSSPEGTWWQYKRMLWDFCGITKADAKLVLGKEIDELLSQRQFYLRRWMINRKALLWLHAALDDEKIAWVWASADSDVRYCTVDKFSFPDKIRIIVLDATASKEELKALFGREFNVLDLNVSWEGRRIHIKHGLSKSKKAGFTAEQFKKHAELIRSHIPPDSKKWLLCTHKADEKKTLERIKEAIPEVEWMSSHYFAGRGENKFEDVDGVYCFGLSILNPDEYNEYAAFLFPDDSVQQIKWIEAQNTAEIYQKAHRARFVRHPGKTLIIEGHHWPAIFGKPDEVIDLTRSGDWFDEVKEKALAVFDAVGFFDRVVAALFGIGIRGDEPKLEKIQKEFEKIPETALRVSRPLYRYYIKVRTPSSTLILPKRDNYKDLLSWIQSKRGARAFKAKLPYWGRAWCGAVGDMETAITFYEEISKVAKTSGIDLLLPGTKDFRSELEEEKPSLLRCA